VHIPGSISTTEGKSNQSPLDRSGESWIEKTDRKLIARRKGNQEQSKKDTICKSKKGQLQGGGWLASSPGGLRHMEMVR